MSSTTTMAVETFVLFGGAMGLYFFMKKGDAVKPKTDDLDKPPHVQTEEEIDQQVLQYREGIKNGLFCEPILTLVTGKDGNGNDKIICAGPMIPKTEWDKKQAEPYLEYAAKQKAGYECTLPPTFNTQKNAWSCPSRQYNYTDPTSVNGWDLRTKYGRECAVVNVGPHTVKHYDLNGNSWPDTTEMLPTCASAESWLWPDEVKKRQQEYIDRTNQGYRCPAPNTTDKGGEYCGVDWLVPKPGTEYEWAVNTKKGLLCTKPKEFELPPIYVDGKFQPPTVRTCTGEWVVDMRGANFGGGDGGNAPALKVDLSAYPGYQGSVSAPLPNPTAPKKYTQSKPVLKDPGQEADQWANNIRDGWSCATPGVFQMYGPHPYCTDKWVRAS